MRRASILGTIVAVGLLAAGVAHARQGQAAGALRIEPVAAGLYAILNPGANTIAVRVTDSGVLLVDAMFARDYEEIVTLVRSVTPQPIRYVVSTHHHGDHTGGNARLLEHATIVGHANARAAMMRATPPQPGPPPITYTTSAAIHLGQAEVQLHHPGPGHTNGDTIVYFPDLRAMATGDLFVVLPRVPTIDYANGGTTLGWVPTLDAVLKFPFDAVIPGHGPVARRADVVRFKERLQTLQARTRALIAQGVSRDEYLSRLETGDLGWSADPTTAFARNAAGGFYDELAAR